MQNLESYLADLKSTGKNTIETVEKSLTDMLLDWLGYIISSTNSSRKVFNCPRKVFNCPWKVLNYPRKVFNYLRKVF